MAGTVLELVLDRGRLRYRVDGRSRRRRGGESLAELCRRFGVSEVVLPEGPRWPLRLAALVATVAADPLPPAVAGVSTAGFRLRLDDVAAASAWRYVVDAVARRLQAQSSTNAGSPGGLAGEHGSQRGAEVTQGSVGTSYHQPRRAAAIRAVEGRVR